MAGRRRRLCSTRPLSPSLQRGCRSRSGGTEELAASARQRSPASRCGIHLAFEQSDVSSVGKSTSSPSPAESSKTAAASNHGYSGDMSCRNALQLPDNRILSTTVV
ncbi:unnamed protein product [Urochloa humidicola]